MNNPMDLINKAKELVGNEADAIIDKATHGDVSGAIEEAKEVLADKLDDIPVIGDKLAGMLGGGSRSNEEEASADEEEATEEESTGDSAEESSDDSTEESSDEEETEESSDEESEEETESK